MNKLDYLYEAKENLFKAWAYGRCEDEEIRQVWILLKDLCRRQQILACRREKDELNSKTESIC